MFLGNLVYRIGMAQCIILRGEIQSGKTTALQQWIQGKNAVGILSPVVNGERFLYSIREAAYISFQSPVSTAETISIGRFHFYQKAFDQANEILQQRTNAAWLILDEIGPLELRDQGFAPALKTILTDLTVNLMAVVRNSLVEEVKEKFLLQHAQILSVQNLQSFSGQ